MTEEEIKTDHIRILTEMPDEHKLVLARELLAAAIQRVFRNKGEFITRGEALDSVFKTEAASREAGAVPKVDFFLPIYDDLPFVTRTDDASSSVLSGKC